VFLSRPAADLLDQMFDSTSELFLLGFVLAIQKQPHASHSQTIGDLLFVFGMYE
jgi:hypothetical protein